MDPKTTFLRKLVLRKKVTEPCLSDKEKEITDFTLMDEDSDGAIEVRRDNYVPAKEAPEESDGRVLR